MGGVLGVDRRSFGSTKLPRKQRANLRHQLSNCGISVVGYAPRPCGLGRGRRIVGEFTSFLLFSSKNNAAKLT